MQSNENYAFLGNYSEHEVEFIESLLKSSGIPTMRKYPGTGGYLEVYMGYNAFGIDIYVPTKKIKEAMSILKKDEQKLKIDNNKNKEVQTEDLSKTQKDEKSIFRNIRLIMKIILIIFIILNISFLLFSALKSLIKLLY